jgi:riboflavin synthase
LFTGIIKSKGTVARMEPKGGDLRLTITAAGLPWEDYEIGESIAVNGVCLTAVSFVDHGFVTDVSSETLQVTALNSLVEGRAVNLEPAISLGERLGGHLVSGHVDCVGVVRSRKGDARSIRLAIDIAPEYKRYVAKKGSVCLDGVSLTVNEVSDATFEVNIIPHTAEMTIIGNYEVGDQVNIEVDLLARYLERLLNADAEQGMTKDFLRDHGYA